MSTLRMQGLVIQAGAKTLVQGLDLDLNGGEIVALVGASGSGKSLTARALLGMIPFRPGVVAGELELRADEDSVRPYRSLVGRPYGRHALDRAFRGVRGAWVGYLPQDARGALDPLARVGRQVRVAARLSGRDPDPLPWLRRAHLADAERVARLFPHELSGGMAQRVVIAQALARGSRFVLADEPTSALDPTVQASILDELRSLAADGIGVLLITHDLRVLPGLAQRVLLIDRGRIVEHTRPEDLRSGSMVSEAGQRLVRATRKVAGGVLG